MRKTQPKSHDFVEHSKPDVLTQKTGKIEIYDQPLDGVVIIPAAILQTDWGRRPNLLPLFLHILVRARREEIVLDCVPVGRGELLISRNTLAAITGLSVQKVRTGLKALQDAGVIGIKTKTTKSAAMGGAVNGPAHGYTIIKIIEFDQYTKR